MVILVDREAFSNAVEQMLIAVAKATDSEGRLCPIRPTPFRMALELRAAMYRCLPEPAHIEVEGWHEMIGTMKPPFPPDIARGTGRRGGGATEEDGA